MPAPSLYGPKDLLNPLPNPPSSNHCISKVTTYTTFTALSPPCLGREQQEQPHLADFAGIRRPWNTGPSALTQLLHEWHMKLNHTTPRAIRDMARSDTFLGIPNALKRTPPTLTCSSCAHAKSDQGHINPPSTFIALANNSVQILADHSHLPPPTEITTL